MPQKTFYYRWVCTNPDTGEVRDGVSKTALEDFGQGDNALRLQMLNLLNNYNRAGAYLKPFRWQYFLLEEGEEPPPLTDIRD